MYEVPKMIHARIDDHAVINAMYGGGANLFRTNQIRVKTTLNTETYALRQSTITIYHTRESQEFAFACEHLVSQNCASISLCYRTIDCIYNGFYHTRLILTYVS